MFISEEQLKKRLESSLNVCNIITNKQPDEQPDNFTGQPNPPVKENLPGETSQQRAARIARTSIKQDEKHGEYTANPNIGNDIVRSTIGILSATGASSQSIQKEFGVTRNQITGARKSKKLNIAKRIEHGKDRVSELALDRLLDTLGLLTTEKIACEKTKDQALIATNLAKVVSSMTKRTEEKEGTKVSLTVISPGLRDMSSFTTIDV